MDMKARLACAALLASISFGVMAQDPTINEVYQTAAHGQLTEAQHMMAQVLKDHPSSAKAHYVDAELLTRQGQLGRAKEELAQAERLQPGLPFAQPAAVDELRAKLTPVAQASWSGAPVQTTRPLPWGWIICAMGLVGLGFVWWRARQPIVGHGQPVLLSPSGGSGGYGGFGGNAAYGGATYSPYPGGPMPASGGGLGSQMLGGLATGAAVGAGMVAGEALMHRFMGGDERRDMPVAQPFDAQRYVEPQPDASYDMGGQDFGLRDAGGWDDNSSSGGSDDGWS